VSCDRFAATGAPECTVPCAAGRDPAQLDRSRDRLSPAIGSRWASIAHCALRDAGVRRRVQARRNSWRCGGGEAGGVGVRLRAFSGVGQPNNSRAAGVEANLQAGRKEMRDLRGPPPNAPW
jgi:hypothetical protein